MYENEEDTLKDFIENYLRNSFQEFINTTPELDAIENIFKRLFNYRISARGDERHVRTNVSSEGARKELDEQREYEETSKAWLELPEVFGKSDISWRAKIEEDRQNLAKLKYYGEARNIDFLWWIIDKIKFGTKSNGETFFSFKTNLYSPPDEKDFTKEGEGIIKKLMQRAYEENNGEVDEEKLKWRVNNYMNKKRNKVYWNLVGEVLVNEDYSGEFNELNLSSIISNDTHNWRVGIAYKLREDEESIFQGDFSQRFSGDFSKIFF